MFFVGFPTFTVAFYLNRMTHCTNKTYLSKPKIFSFSECLHFLDRGYDDCLYAVSSNRVRKPLEIDGNRLLIEVTDSDQQIEVTLLAGEESQQTLGSATEFVSHWFDLGRNLKPFYKLLDRHEPFSGMSDRFYGLRLMGIPDLFEALCWCVIGQQINLTFAYRLKRRLVETYGTFITYEGDRYYYFPEPEVLARLKIEDLKKLQLSRQKAEYLIGIARLFKTGDLTKQQLLGMESGSQVLSRLTQIRGVGQWTANYVAMKSLKQMNCITYGDTGLQSAVSSILGLDRKPSRKEIDALFGPFAGWESYLVIYCWRMLS